MSEIEARVVAHYGGGGIVESILADLETAGFDPGAPRAPDAPRPFDSFHIGGAEAVDHLLDAMPPLDGAEVLDIGCGVGGTARALARRGARATGIDLTPEFIEAAGVLSRMVGAPHVAFAVANALDLPFPAARFDHATMIHVGINVADKPRLMAEAARVLRPEGTFALFEIMRVEPGDLAYPMPWALDAETSFPAGAQDYLAAARVAGFEEVARLSRGAYGVAFLEALLSAEPAGTILTAPRVARIENLLDAMRAGLLAPVEMILRRGA